MEPDKSQIPNVENDTKFNYFLTQRRLKPQTIARYTRELTLYSESTGKSLSDLIQESRDEQINVPWMSDRQLPQQLNQFIMFMESREYSPLRIQNALRIVRTFYNEFEIILPKTKYKAEPKNFHQSVDDLPGHTDIRTAMNLSNLKWKSIISLMASSGLSMIDVRELKVSDFLSAIGADASGDIPQKDEVSTDKIPCWKLLRVKTGNPFVTFSTPESCHLILEYLHQHPPDGSDEYLFRSRQGTQLFSSQFQNQFANINRSAGWEKVGYTWYFTTKTLRKFFANTMGGLKIPHRDIRIMMGHKVDIVTQSYFKQNIPTLLESYKDAMPALTFFDQVQIVETEVDITKNPEFIKMRDELNYLKRMEEGRNKMMQRDQAAANRAWEERQRKKKN